MMGLQMSNRREPTEACKKHRAKIPVSYYHGLRRNPCVRKSGGRINSSQSKTISDEPIQHMSVKGMKETLRWGLGGVVSSVCTKSCQNNNYA